MTGHRFFSLILFVALTLAAAVSPAQAQINYFSETKYNLDWYIYHLGQGNYQSAAAFYNEALRVARQGSDVRGLAYLAYINLHYGYEREAIQLFDEAERAAGAYAFDRTNAQNQTYGKGALEFIVSLYNGTLRTMRTSAGTLDALRVRAEHATYLQKQLGATTPNSTVGRYAAAGGNNLAGTNRTRGFGDSEQVDTWVPFTVETGDGRGTYNRAVLILRVKPIGQLIGTDQLIVRGASGRAYVVYADFNRLTPDVWTTIEVDLTGNADVMQAVRNGRLEGVVQDDTAVEWVYLKLNN